MSSFIQAEASYLAAPEDESPYIVEPIEPSCYWCEHSNDGASECDELAEYEITDYSEADIDHVTTTWLCSKHYREWDEQMHGAAQ